MKTKHFKSRHALLMSLTSLTLCVSMLFGATFAWFTDSVTSGVNRIVSGNLDVELYHGSNNEKVSNTTKLFDDIELWEPGAVAYETLTVANEGNLALKYQLGLNVANATVSPKDTTKTLADALKVAVIDTADYSVPNNRAQLIADAKAATNYGNLATLVKEGDLLAGATMAENESDTYTVVIYWEPTDSDNLFNMNNANQGTKLTIDIGVTLAATQLNHEADSFDNTYDAGLALPVVNVASSNAITSDNGDNDLIITSSGDIKSATVPAAAANTVFSSFNPSTADGTSNEMTMNLNVTKTGETTTETSTTVALEIDMTAIMKTTVGTDAPSITTKNVTDLGNNYVTIEYNLGTGKDVTGATHNGNAMFNSADTNDDTGYGVYSYNSATGILTIKTKSFSPFTVSYSVPAYDVLITEDGNSSASPVGKSLAEFRNLVDQGYTYAGYTVTLQRDVDLNNEGWNAIGNKEEEVWFCGTFDGNGHNISGLKIENATGDEEYSALFSAAKNATIKNLTVEGSVSGKNVSGIVARMDGGTLENCISRVTVSATAGKAGGLVVLAQINCADGSVTTIKNCKNYGAVSTVAAGSNHAGGVVSMVKPGVTVISCENHGNVSHTGAISTPANAGSGGIVGWAMNYSQADNADKYDTYNNLPLKIESCVNNAGVSANSSVVSVGSILGGAAATVTITGCTPTNEKSVVVTN